MTLLYGLEKVISKPELENLGPELAKALVSTSYIAQEIQEFMRLVNGAIVEHNAKQKVQLMQSSQRGTLLRALALKADNFLYLWKHLLSKAEFRSEDKSGILEELFKKYANRFLDLTAHPGHGIAEHIRNRMTAHTDLVATKKSIELFHEEWSVSILFSPDIGNSFFALGEDIVFGSGLMHQTGLKGTDNEITFSQEEALQRLTAWQDYTIEASQFCLQYHFELIHDIPQKCLGRTGAPWVDLTIPAKRYSSREDFRLPVYTHT